MALGTAAALLGGGLVAGAAGSIVQANAAKSAGEAQVAAADRALQQQIQARKEGIAQAQDVARMSPSELKSINNLLSDKMNMVNRSLLVLEQQQKTLDAADPAVKAAGKNLYDLLSGKAADILKPLQQQQEIQRQQLNSRLASAMGPGYLTSTAGLQALITFDQQAAMTNAKAQLDAVSTAVGVFGTTFGEVAKEQSALNSGIQNLFATGAQIEGAALTAEQNAASRVTNATIGAMGANPIGYTNPVQYAGNPFAGQSQLGAGLGQLGGMGLGLGAAGVLNPGLFGANSTGAVPGSTPAATGTTSPFYNPGNVAASNGLTSV